MQRQYFSERHGRGPKSRPLPFEELRALAVSVLDWFEERGFFQESFGKECPDGNSHGTVGPDRDAFFMRKIGRRGIWPFRTTSYDDYGPFPDDQYLAWDADTMFDALEVLHDLVAKPLRGRNHDYNNCGMHYSEFHAGWGRTEFIAEINEVLRLGDPGHEMTPEGEIVQILPEGFEPLVDADVPDGTEDGSAARSGDTLVMRLSGPVWS